MAAIKSKTKRPSMPLVCNYTNQFGPQMKLSIKIMLFVLLSSLSSYHCKQSTMPYISIEDCSSDEYFDIITLDCKKCDYDNDRSTNTIGAARNNSAYGKMKSYSGFECTCRLGFYKLYQDKGFQCLLCPSGTVTSIDGLHCSLCSSNHPFQPSSKQCVPCPSNSIIDERFIANSSEEPRMERYCKPCPDGSKPVANDSSQCIPCHASMKNCSCPKDHYTLYGGLCLPNGNLITEKVDLYKVTYENGEQVNSAFFMENLQSSIYQCQYQGNRSACQLLANLCTFLNYNLYETSSFGGFIGINSVKSKANACTEFLKLSKLPSVPFLIYGDNGVNELKKANVISKMFKIDSRLELIAARYNVHGTLVDYSPLKLGELQLCQSEPDSLDSGFYFGTNYYQKCEIDLRTLWDTKASSISSILLYDLYLLDDDQEPNTVYPIPVIVTNLMENGEAVNKGDDEQKRRLVRRFYLAEALIGIELKKDGISDTPLESSKSSEAFKGSSKLSEGSSDYMRYAQSITINIAISKTDGSGSIYTPWIKITYGTVTKEDYINGIKVPIEFCINYSADQSKNARDLSICQGVFCGFAVLIALFRAWAWTKRQGKQAVDPVTISEFLLISISFLADAFFLVCLGFSIHSFIIYKQQSVIHGLLPSTSFESTIRIYLYIAFALKCVKILHDLIILSHTNIFLIDWERPRVITVTKRSRPEETERKTVNDDGILSANKKASASISSAGAGTRKSSASGNASSIGLTEKISQDKLHFAHCPAVSIWRTYFVANEWIKLCTYRRIKTSLHLFLVLLFLIGFGLENLATSDTQNNLKRDSGQRFVPESQTCRLAIGSLVFFLLGLAQLGWHRMFQERMYKNKLDEFVDLCSVSNVSLFCLLYQRFGFYIHGRSPNGRADVNMKEMHELLKREEDDLCSKRGLLPNTDQQTFEMLLPTSINDQCNRIRALLTTYSQGAERMQGVGGHLFKVDLEKVVPTYVMLTKFLSGYIEHAFKDADYTVKDKSNVESILAFELAEPGERGFLYNDNGHSFDQLLFCGNEFKLFTFEFMLFIFIDLITHNFVAAATFTFLIIEIIKSIYIVAYKRNIVKKALIDERFLM
ncbi:meckelin-like [Tetranychus urticae]|uniref:Meckelin n=1 Tax=Tetranychus urticae TaxID=32264 RepID=T1KY17_TETUR|nr:meckelin-like [Tetranychus urticae]XP_025017884.1 meckelin-like [Tetranychus urticae]